MAKKKKLPTDVNKKAFSIVQIATSEDTEITREKNPAAVALGKLGGLKGGHSRAKALTSKRRSDIAKKAASARWGKKE